MTKHKSRPAQFAPKLLVESGPDQGAECPIHKPITLVGRNESCDLVVDDPLVSRRHCQITWDGVYCTVEDLGSTNGTVVNGQPLTTAHVLRPDDRIKVAEVTFHFVDPQATLVGQKWPKLQIDQETQGVTVNEQAVKLSTKEYTLLAYLYDHADRICTKEEITRAVWPDYLGDVFDYQVESLVKRLRQKLEPDQEESHLVLTVQGRGYRLLRFQ